MKYTKTLKWVIPAFNIMVGMGMITYGSIALIQKSDEEPNTAIILLTTGGLMIVGMLSALILYGHRHTAVVAEASMATSDLEPALPLTRENLTRIENWVMDVNGHLHCPEHISPDVSENERNGPIIVNIIDAEALKTLRARQDL